MASPLISFDVNFDIDSVLSHVKYDLQANFGINDSSTPAYWHECASGTAYFYKINDVGTKTLESGKYFFNTGVAGGSVFYGGGMSVDLVPDSWGSGVASLSGTGGTHPSITYTCSGSHSLTNSCIQSGVTGHSVKIWLDGFEQPTFDLRNPSGTWKIAIAFYGTSGYSTSPAIHSISPSTPYLPIADTSQSYNDVRNLILLNYNEQNPSETISESDLPTWDEIQETENISFTLDYDEILSEDELESILKETQYILDTTPAENLNFPDIQSQIESMQAETISSSVGTAVSEIFDISAQMPTDLIAVWGGLAVFGVLFWWLSRR